MTLCQFLMWLDSYCGYYFILEVSFVFNCRNQEGMLVSYAFPTSVSTFPFSLVSYFWLHQDRAAERPSSHERTCSMQRILQHCLSGQQHPQGQRLLANDSFAALCGIGQQLPVDLRQPPRNRFPELS